MVTGEYQDYFFVWIAVRKLDKIKKIPYDRIFNNPIANVHLDSDTFFGYMTKWRTGPIQDAFENTYFSAVRVHSILHKYNLLSDKLAIYLNEFTMQLLSFFCIIIRK